MNGLFDTIKKPSSVYPQTYTGFPEDQDDWSAYQFIDYFEANRDLVGQSQAVQYLGQDISKLNWFADLYDSKFDCYVLEYFTKEIGQDFPTMLGYAACGVKSAVTGTTEAITNVGKTISVITKPVVIIPLVVGAAALLTSPYWLPLLKKQKRG